MGNELRPKLRFSEFKNIKSWKKVKLSDVLTEHKIKNDGKCEVHSVSVYKGIVNQIEHLGRNFAATDKSKYNLVKPYDIVYTKSPTGDFPYGIIKQNLNKYNVIVSPLYGVFTPINKYLGYILAAYFESPIRANNYLLPIIKRGAKNTILISNDTFLSRELYLPNNELEQQKIASCISSIDDFIVAQKQKLDELKKYKKGLMQKLLKPKKNWERKTLNEVGTFSKGSGISGEQLKNSGMPCVCYGDLYTKYDTKFCISQNFIDKNDIKKSISVNKGTLLFAATGETTEEIGKCVCYYGEEIIYVGGDIIILQTKGIDPIFIAYQQNLFSSIKQKARFGQGYSIVHIRLEDIKKIIVSFPKDIKEQQKIASCLSSIDDLINVQNQKLETFKIHKKGLMQQLFPNTKE